MSDRDIQGKEENMFAQLRGCMHENAKVWRKPEVPLIRFEGYGVHTELKCGILPARVPVFCLRATCAVSGYPRSMQIG